MFQKISEQVYVKLKQVYFIMDILFKNQLRTSELDEFKLQASKLKQFVVGSGNDMVEIDLCFLLFLKQK